MFNYIRNAAILNVKLALNIRSFPITAMKQHMSSLKYDAYYGELYAWMYKVAPAQVEYMFNVSLNQWSSMQKALDVVLKVAHTLSTNEDDIRELASLIVSQVEEIQSNARTGVVVEKLAVSAAMERKLADMQVVTIH